MAAFQRSMWLAASAMALAFAASAHGQTLDDKAKASTADAKTLTGSPETPQSELSRSDGLADIIVTAQKTAMTLHRHRFRCRW